MRCEGCNPDLRAAWARVRRRRLPPSLRLPTGCLHRRRRRSRRTRCRRVRASRAHADREADHRSDAALAYDQPAARTQHEVTPRVLPAKRCEAAATALAHAVPTVDGRWQVAVREYGTDLCEECVAIAGGDRSVDVRRDRGHSLVAEERE